MTIRTYSSPEAFKQALEQRLRTSAKTGAEFARKRQLIVFDRFLARVVAVLGDAATLKGGLVLELRLERARTTKDVDLRMMGPPDGAGRLWDLLPQARRWRVPHPAGGAKGLRASASDVHSAFRFGEWLVVPNAGIPPTEAQRQDCHHRCIDA
jgi:hypothetical protein